MPKPKVWNVLSSFRIWPGKTFFGLDKSKAHCFTLPKELTNQIIQYFGFSEGHLQTEITFLIGLKEYPATVKWARMDRRSPRKLAKEDLPKRDVVQFGWKKYVLTQFVLRDNLRQSFGLISRGHKNDVGSVTFIHTGNSNFIVQFSRQFPSGNETKPHSISSEEKNKNRKWTEEEITASVDAYVEMLKKEITGKPYRKTEYNAKLRKNHLNNRTKASVELRMQNISAVFDELGLVWIKGYKPRKHVGSKVKQMIIRVIQSLDNTTLMLISSQRDNYSKTDYWWESDPEEKYWLELTDRVDIGTNLHTPQTNQSGKEFWGYSFVKLTQPGDVVFHFDKRKGAIVAFSVVADLPVREERIKWVARGKSAKGIIRHWRPGWMRSFSNHFILEKPITLANFRDQGNNIKKMVDSIPLNLSKKKALYFPFELKSSRPMRPMQGYVFKFPKSMIDIFPELMIATPAPIPKVEGRHANYDDDYDTDLKIKIL